MCICYSMYVCLYVYLSVILSVKLSVYLVFVSVCLSVPNRFLFISISVYVSISCVCLPLCVYPRVRASVVSLSFPFLVLSFHFFSFRSLCPLYILSLAPFIPPSICRDTCIICAGWSRRMVSCFTSFLFPASWQCSAIVYEIQIQNMNVNEE
jgi:hypothetical protein